MSCLKPCCYVAIVWGLALTAPALAEDAKPVTWRDNYGDALRLAEKQGKMLLIQFRGKKPNAHTRRWENQVLTDAGVQKKLREMVLVRVPMNVVAKEDGKPVELLKHDAFTHMYGREGFAIVDLAHKDKDYYHHVVSAFGFSNRVRVGPNAMKVILELPPGTLTQRTLVYAVRMHPEAPRSTRGSANAMLFSECQSHSNHQASILVQGHHNWGSRFHSIIGRLPGGASAAEVCAESWPGEELVEAAIECVNSWRQSSGHWNGVNSFHPYYGYDMKLGANGVWYATGIFGRSF